MPPASPLVDDDLLVPSARLGAALHRARLQSGATLAGLARAGEQRFLPDQLVAIERGEVALSDAEIVALTGLYELTPRPWASATDLDLVLDRAPMSDHAAGRAGASATGPERSRSETLQWVAARFVALSVLTGLDVTSGPVGLDVFAEAVESSVDFAVDLLEMTLERDAMRIGRMIGAMELRVVVPQIGFLVGETAMGTLLLVGHGGDEARPVPACGTLGDLLDAAR